MSNIDRQIVNRLDTLHRELFGGHMDNHCRWYYSSIVDVYHCPHTAFKGSEIIALIPDPFVEKASLDRSHAE